MKNNCDVSGDFPRCLNSCGCKYARKQTWADCDYKLSNGEICCNLSAIRAAIDIEREGRYEDEDQAALLGEIQESEGWNR